MFVSGGHQFLDFNTIHIKLTKICPGLQRDLDEIASRHTTVNT